MIRLKGVKRDKRYRSVKRNLLCGLLGIVTLGIVAYQGISYFANPSQRSSFVRQLLWTDEEEDALSDYPEALSEDALKNGAVILHLIGILYMFLAIAVVCDEFFVPAIEVIVDKLDMSPDTAGATFMAAGGSAPELFTSFIGTFTESTVGFGTIVGSAVFNVLFVIGCCAVFSSGDLVLTWYPFARDCTYYILSLLLLALFFGIITPDIIDWWEALILLLMYGGYVTLMINNTKLYDYLQQKFMKPENTTTRMRAESQLRVVRPLNFTVSLFDLLTADAKLSDITGIHMVARIKGDVKATFKQVDTNGDGTIDKEEFSRVIFRLGKMVDPAEVDKCYKELDENDDGKIDFDEFQRWYMRSEARMDTDIRQIFQKFDHDQSGTISITELRSLLKAVHEANDEVNVEPTDEEVNNAKNLLDKDNNGQISESEFMEWYKSSIFFDKAVQRRNTLIAEEEKAEEEGMTLKFPENTVGRINYIITIPIIYPLYYTVPDVRKARWTNYYPLAFIMSISWLGVYSWLMVWWATTFGVTAGIPIAVLGLTLLAAGTSVPDLLTSIIVAKHGEGDMAVSSSIGSNIFDVLIGLPLPWFSYSIVRGITDNQWKVGVAADSLFISIIVLFIMLLAVLLSIKCNKWRMTKKLGYIMFGLYGLFVLQDLLRTYGVIDLDF